MDFLQLMKALVEAGVLVVIAAIFLLQQAKLFAKQEQVIQVITKQIIYIFKKIRYYRNLQ